MSHPIEAAGPGSRRIDHQPYASGCYAPSVSLYFDVHGMVLACCRNRTHALGDIREQTIAEIWSGPQAETLRAALQDDDFGHGCQSCQWEIEAGNIDGSLPVGFDPLPVGEWPVQMEFALSNVCNLQCVMCSGEYSSAIRSQREGLPPLRSPYGEGFFAQLGPFLERLRVARFFGGEPFLVPEYQRIWDLMVEVGSPAVCNVTTNGTVRTARVEAALAALPFSIGVSVDGFSRETVESVRVGADFDVVMGNVAWFRRYCSEQGTGFGLTYCLMTVNWQEFADFLAFADDLDAAVSVNRVVSPPHLSLLHLERDDLAEVVAGLSASPPREGRNAAVWRDELSVLRSRLAELDLRGRCQEHDSQPAHDSPAVVVGHGLDEMGTGDLSEVVAAAASVMGAVPLVVETDEREVVRAASASAVSGLSTGDWVGRPAVAAMSALGAELGHDVQVELERTHLGVTSRLFAFGGGVGWDRDLVLFQALAPSTTGGPTYVVTVARRGTVVDQPRRRNLER